MVNLLNRKSMRYFVYVVVFFCFYMNALYGQQNLVLNPSFEDVNEEELLCSGYSANGEFENAMNNWKSISSPDIYHTSLPVICQANPRQMPRTGQSMIGMFNYHWSVTLEEVDLDIFPNTEFIEGQLSTPLVQGHTYRIRFYVLLHRSFRFGSNNFGIKFFENSHTERDQAFVRRDVDANHTSVVNDRENWSLIELEFTPQISELTHFIIGNFFGFGETEAGNEEEMDAIITYYFVDDVSIIDLTPTFQPLGPFCKGAIFTLPEHSENGHIGSWSPSVNNQETTTYTFTPDNPEAESVILTVEIIEPHIEPFFDIETTRCKGTTFTLPRISENGITGSWSPEINNQQTTTYTFTPEAGSCALEASITIEVVEILTPEFTLPSFICEGSTLVLPELSNNGISGTWSPAVDNQQTTTYTFKPIGNACAVPVTVKIEVERIDTSLLNYYCTKNDLYVEVVNPNVENQFQWQINGIAIDESLPTIQLSKYANLLHENQNIVTVHMTNTSGCVTSSTIEIENKNLCVIPRGISPQGDGVNETFDISSFGGVSLQIFNRYGMKVYSKKNYQNEWFGQTNSSIELLPNGTYFYQIVTNKGETLSGWVQLMY